MKAMILMVLALTTMPAWADGLDEYYEMQREVRESNRDMREKNYQLDRYMQQEEANEIAREQLRIEKLQFQQDFLNDSYRDRY